MMGGPHNRWKGAVKRFLRCTAPICLTVLPARGQQASSGQARATGQQTDPLEQLSQQLKKQDETSTHDLEQRVATGGRGGLRTRELHERFLSHSET